MEFPGRKIRIKILTHAQSHRIFYNKKVKITDNNSPGKPRVRDSPVMRNFLPSYRIPRLRLSFLLSNYSVTPCVRMSRLFHSSSVRRRTQPCSSCMAQCMCGRIVSMCMCMFVCVSERASNDVYYELLDWPWWCQCKHCVCSSRVYAGSSLGRRQNVCSQLSGHEDYRCICDTPRRKDPHAHP